MRQVEGETGFFERLPVLVFAEQADLVPFEKTFYAVGIATR